MPDSITEELRDRASVLRIEIRPSTAPGSSFEGQQEYLATVSVDRMILFELKTWSHRGPATLRRLVDVMIRELLAPRFGLRRIGQKRSAKNEATT